MSVMPSSLIPNVSNLLKASTVYIYWLPKLWNVMPNKQDVKLLITIRIKILEANIYLISSMHHAIVIM